MNTLKLIFTITITSFTLIGCASNLNLDSTDTNAKDSSNSNINYKRYYKEYNGYNHDTKYEPMINYKFLAKDAVKQIFEKNKIPSKIIVTDFVDLKSLKNNSNIGYILSNSVKDSIINLYETDVIEAEVSKYFKLSAKGLRLLTRDVNKVKSLNYNIDNAVVGTYIYNKNELIVFVKLIDLKTGMIKGSYTNSMLIGKDTIISMSYENK